MEQLLEIYIRVRAAKANKPRGAPINCQHKSMGPYVTGGVVLAASRTITAYP